MESTHFHRLGEFCNEENDKNVFALTVVELITRLTVLCHLEIVSVT